MSEVCEMPGKVEFDVICEDIRIAQSGALAWVRAGIRLRCVKEALPHGEFMKWIDAKCASMRNLTSKHLCRAKTTADRLVENLESYGTKLSNEEALAMLDSPDSKLRQWIGGKTPTQLNLELKEARLLKGEQLEDEEKAKIWCEEYWVAHPEERDDWEPRIIADEVSYVLAKAGIMGSDATKGKTKSSTDHKEYLRKNLAGAVRHFKHFENLDSKQKEEIQEASILFAQNCPDSLIPLIQKNLGKGGKNE